MFRVARPLRVVSLVVVCLVILVGMSAVFAQLPQPDGRINQVHHFGGDALYCVDRNMNPTGQYDDFGEGGFRLLNQHGQELWFIPSSTVDIAAAESQANQQTVLVERGQGSYGATELYASVRESGDIFFTFFGYDEHGKQNRIDFKFCEPVGPVPQPTREPASDPIPTPTQPILLCNLTVACEQSDGVLMCDAIGVVECSACPPGQFAEEGEYIDFLDFGPACASGIPFA